MSPSWTILRLKELSKEQREKMERREVPFSLSCAELWLQFRLMDVHFLVDATAVRFTTSRKGKQGSW